MGLPQRPPRDPTVFSGHVKCKGGPCEAATEPAGGQGRADPQGCGQPQGSHTHSLAAKPDGQKGTHGFRSGDLRIPPAPSGLEGGLPGREGRGGASPVTAPAQEGTAQQPAQEVGPLRQQHLPAIHTRGSPVGDTSHLWASQELPLAGVPRMSGWKGTLDVLLQFLPGKEGTGTEACALVGVAGGALLTLWSSCAVGTISSGGNDLGSPGHPRGAPGLVSLLWMGLHPPVSSHHSPSTAGPRASPAPPPALCPSRATPRTGRRAVLTGFSRPRAPDLHLHLRAQPGPSLQATDKGVGTVLGHTTADFLFKIRPLVTADPSLQVGRRKPSRFGPRQA